jgi:CMP-N-acetylneuraminic acid synthetase
MAPVGFIFARGGSKGIPNKNLQTVGGRPLITRAIETGQATAGIERILVSTDSDEIAEVALAAGAEVPFLRPEQLAGDASPEWLSWKHALTFLEEMDGQLPESFVSIPATSPLRLTSDVEACLTAYGQGNWDAIITVTEAQRNPFFNMVSLDSSAQVHIALPNFTIFAQWLMPFAVNLC